MSVIEPLYQSVSGGFETADADDTVVNVFVGRIPVDSDYTIREEDHFIAVTDTSASRTLTVSEESVKDGKIIVVADETGNASVNNITIETEGSAQINGSSTFVIDTDYDRVTLHSDGTDFYI